MGVKRKSQIVISYSTMSSRMKRIVHCALVCFLCFHVLAVGIESIPVSAKDPISLTLRKTVQPITRSYARLTGQWQTWNLFAPDPPTKVPSLHIDIREEGEWQERMLFSSETLPWWRSTNMLKIIRYFAEETDKYEGPRTTFFEGLCKELDLSRGTEARARFVSIDFMNTDETSLIEYLFMCTS